MEGLTVTVLDPTGSKSIKARISPTVLVSKIMPNLITKLSLPSTTPDGNPVSYSLDCKRLGMRLREDRTLPEQNVQDQDILIAYPEITAGG